VAYFSSSAFVASPVCPFSLPCRQRLPRTDPANPAGLLTGTRPPRRFPLWGLLYLCRQGFAPMRIIERQMNRAINDCIDWKNANTEVTYSPERNASYVMLHGNHIATVGDTWLELYNCGYKTATTKSRLNAILSEHGCGERIHQKDFEWFVSTKEGTVPFTEGMTLR